jgi:hypothetical protein
MKFSQNHHYPTYKDKYHLKSRMDIIMLPLLRLHNSNLQLFWLCAIHHVFDYIHWQHFWTTKNSWSKYSKNTKKKTGNSITLKFTKDSQISYNTYLHSKQRAFVETSSKMHKTKKNGNIWLICYWFSGTQGLLYFDRLRGQLGKTVLAILTWQQKDTFQR